MVQWVKSLTAAAPVTAEAQVQSLAHCSGLRIQYCHSYSIDHSCSSDSVPGWGTSICHGVAIRKMTFECEYVYHRIYHIYSMIMYSTLHSM